MLWAHTPAHHAPAPPRSWWARHINSGAAVAGQDPAGPGADKTTPPTGHPSTAEAAGQRRCCPCVRPSTAAALHDLLRALLLTRTHGGGEIRHVLLALLVRLVRLVLLDCSSGRQRRARSGLAWPGPFDW